jgi:hypothetical protein
MLPHAINMAVGSICGRQSRLGGITHEVARSRRCRGVRSHGVLLPSVPEALSAYGPELLRAGLRARPGSGQEGLH